MSFLDEPTWYEKPFEERKADLDAVFNQSVARDPRFEQLDEQQRQEARRLFETQLLGAPLEQSTPQQEMGDFSRGLRAGGHNVAAGLYGSAGILGSVIENEDVQDWGMEGYKKHTEAAQQYPTLKFADVDSPGAFVDYLQGLAGQLAPSMLEAAGGAILGGGLGYTVAKRGVVQAAKQMAENAIETQIKKGVVKRAAKDQAQAKLEKELVRGTLKGFAKHGADIKKRAGKAGMFTAVAALESGLNYGELLEEHGIDAPVSALAFGSLGASLELLGGNIKLVDAFVDGVAKRAPGGYLKRLAKELLTNAPAEAFQETGQEVLSILNTVVNTDEKFLTPENVSALFESGAAGFFAGTGGAAVQATFPAPSISDAKTVDDAVKAFEQTVQPKATEAWKDVNPAQQLYPEATEGILSLPEASAQMDVEAPYFPTDIAVPGEQEMGVTPMFAPAQKTPEEIVIERQRQGLPPRLSPKERQDLIDATPIGEIETAPKTQKTGILATPKARQDRIDATQSDAERAATQQRWENESAALAPKEKPDRVKTAAKTRQDIIDAETLDLERLEQQAQKATQEQKMLDETEGKKPVTEEPLTFPDKLMAQERQEIIEDVDAFTAKEVVERAQIRRKMLEKTFVPEDQIRKYPDLLDEFDIIPDAQIQSQQLKQSAVPKLAQQVQAAVTSGTLNLEAVKREAARAQQENDTNRSAGLKRLQAILEKPTEELTQEELRTALRTNPLTGLKNRRAYNEDATLEIQASVDADSLKWVNDNVGHEAGDELLRMIGEALYSDNTYHVSGDEFIIQASSEQEIETLIENARKHLDANPIALKTDDAIIKLKGAFSYGTGKTFKEADQKLREQKVARTASGDRASRGEKPAAVVQRIPERRTNPDEEVKFSEAAELKRLKRKAEPAPQEAVPESSSKLKRALTPVGDTNTVKDVKAKTKRQKALTTLGEALGIKVKFFSSNDDRINRINGVSFPDSTDIFINTAGAKPELFVLGHETIHRLKQMHPEAYEHLRKVLLETSKVEDRQAHGERLNKARKLRGADVLSEESLIEEFIADFAGEEFTKDTFWDKMYQSSPLLTKKVMDTIANIIYKIQQVLSSVTGAVSNKAKAREALRKALREMMAAQTAAVEGRNTALNTLSEKSIAPIWYSQMVDFLNKKLNKGPAKQIKTQVLSWAGLNADGTKKKKASPQFKAEELEWSGLIEWLEKQDGKVTPEKVQEYLKDNRVQLIEVHRGWIKKDGATNRKIPFETLTLDDMRTYMAFQSAKEAIDSGALVREPDGSYEEINEGAVYESFSDLIDTLKDELYASDSVEESINDFNIANFDDPSANWKKEMLSMDAEGAGGETLEFTELSLEDKRLYMATLAALQNMADGGIYREGEGYQDTGGEAYYPNFGALVATHIDTLYSNASDAELIDQFIEAGYPQPQAGWKEGVEIAAPSKILKPPKYDRAALKLPGGEDYFEILFILKRPKFGLTYRSSHWAEDDVLIHVRGHARIVDGERILQIEEIQSDWHQGAFQKRKEKVKELSKETGVSLKEAQLFIPDDDSYMSKASEARLLELEQRKAELKDAKEKASEYDAIQTELIKIDKKIPSAPFKSSKAWGLTAIKRMVRYAAENGFDSIAWTDGVTQAERSNLMIHVNKLKVTRVSKEGEHSYAVKAYPSDGFAAKEFEVVDADLGAYVGAEMAEKIRDEKLEFLDTKVYKGLDLNIGGKGMIGFYDKILVTETNEFFGKKKWGKAKVRDLKLYPELNITAESEIKDQAPKEFMISASPDEKIAFLVQHSVAETMAGNVPRRGGHTLAESLRSYRMSQRELYENIPANEMEAEYKRMYEKVTGHSPVYTVAETRDEKIEVITERIIHDELANGQIYVTPEGAWKSDAWGGPEEPKFTYKDLVDNVNRYVNDLYDDALIDSEYAEYVSRLGGPALLKEGRVRLHKLPITKQMKEKALYTGMPLFSEETDGRTKDSNTSGQSDSKADSTATPKTQLDKFISKFGNRASAAIVPAKTKEQKIIKQIGASFGTDVTFYASEDNNVNSNSGFTYVGRKEIFINTTRKNQKIPLTMILGHEVLHKLQQTNRKDYTRLLLKTLATNADVTKMRMYEQAARAAHKKQGLKELTSDKYMEEFMADLAGEAFQRESFWNQMYVKSPRFTQQIINTIKSILNKLKRVYSQTPKDSLKDVKAFDAELAKVLNTLTNVEERFDLTDIEADEFMTLEGAIEPLTGEDYAQNRKIQKSLKETAVKNIMQFTRALGQTLDEYFGATSTRLKKINPKFANRLRKLDFDTNSKIVSDVAQVEPLMRKARKQMTRDDFADWDYARKNSDTVKINELISKYNLQDEYQNYRDALDIIRERALDVGMDVGYLKDYTPRVLKDAAGFLQALGKGKDWAVISRKLKEHADEAGIDVHEMTTEQKADIVSNMILNPVYGLSAKFKPRKLKKLQAELNKYYLDSDAATMAYIHSMRRAIFTRRFFGKVPEKIAELKRAINQTTKKLAQTNEPEQRKWLEDDLKLFRQRLNNYKYQRDFTENIGEYVRDHVEKGEVPKDAERALIEMLSARFNERGARGIIQAYKNLSYIDTMGSPISALTQLGDLAWSMYEAGFVPTIKHAINAARKKTKITKEDVGIERIAQEFVDPGTLGKAVNKVFRMVGLDKMDSIGKDALLNASLEKYQKRANNEPNKLRKELESIFEGETDSLIQNLKDGAITENVKLLVYHKLLDYQPVALSEMPQKYLTAGNGRIFYMLKTFTLKQFDVYRREIVQKILSGDAATQREGIKNLIRLGSVFVLANAGADEIKDWLLGRSTTMRERTIDNVLRLFGVSKFITWQARTDGMGSALARQILPPFKFFDSVSKDVISAGDEKGLETIRSVPLIGKLAYWHVGKGADKRLTSWERRLSEEAKKLREIESGLEEADNKSAYKSKHVEDFMRLKKLEKVRQRVRKFKRAEEALLLQPETKKTKELRAYYRQEQQKLIKDFLKE